MKTFKVKGFYGFEEELCKIVDAEDSQQAMIKIIKEVESKDGWVLTTQTTELAMLVSPKFQLQLFLTIEEM